MKLGITQSMKKISVADRKVIKCRTEYQRHEANRIQLKDGYIN